MTTEFIQEKEQGYRECSLAEKLMELQPSLPAFKNIKSYFYFYYLNFNDYPDTYELSLNSIS